jgi:hypothetical protein
MYPTLPVESMASAIQFICYFFTVLMAVFGFMLNRS